MAAALLGWALLAGAAPGDPCVAARVEALTRATVWTPVAAIPIRFRTFHPQGMVRIGSDFFVSSVEILRKPAKLPMPVDGQAYDTGAGVGHLFRIGPDGRLLADLKLGEGPIYHPGGIDYDGISIWVPVAEYRPGSRAILYRVSPATMTAHKVLAVPDHIGALVHDTAGGALIGASWGSRRLYRWRLRSDGTVAAGSPETVANADAFIDDQDCHYLGTRRMLCAGVAEYKVHPADEAFQLGGLDLIDLATLRSVRQVPVPLWAPSGRAMTQNPFWMEATATGLRAWFMPDDDVSTLYVFDVAVTHGS